MSQRSFTLFLFFLTVFVQNLTSQTLISRTYLGHSTKSQLDAKFGFPIFKNGVFTYKVTYHTTDAQGMPTVASGLIALPDNPAKVYPLLCYQHGTSSNDNDVPSNLNGESDLPIAFAGMGYLTAAPDYLGLGDSPGFHPYVHAETEASAGVDILRAARDFAVDKSIFLNDQVFITGYSQGGHAAMALHKKLELELGTEFTVTASAPMSGPYSIGEVMRELVLAEEEYYFPAYIPNTVLSYQLMYGNLYNNLSEIFKPAYKPVIEQFANGQIDLQQLNSSLVIKLIQNEGASISVRMFVDTTAQSVTNNPNHPFNLALKDNNVYDWAPAAPTRLFYCMADDQVPFENSVLADSVMNANGAFDLKAQDVDPTADHGGCVLPATLNTFFFFGNYQILQDTIASDNQTVLSKVEVFPNPASDFVFIKNLESGSELHLYDLNGREWLSSKVNAPDTAVPLENFPDGMYLLQIINNGSTRMEKMMIKN